MEKAKSSRQVSEFKDTFDIFEPFTKNWIFEREDFDPLRDYVDSDDEEELIDEIRDDPFDRDVFLKYIKQVRQTFGFDVDVNLPLWLDCLRYFIPNNLSKPFSRACAYKAANFAIDEINADINSKSYELVEVVKNVSTITCFSLEFLTLTAKKVEEDEDEADVVTIQAIVEDPINGPMELHQWRFKPNAAAAA